MMMASQDSGHSNDDDATTSMLDISSSSSSSSVHVNGETTNQTSCEATDATATITTTEPTITPKKSDSTPAGGRTTTTKNIHSSMAPNLVVHDDEEDLKSPASSMRDDGTSQKNQNNQEEGAENLKPEPKKRQKSSSSRLYSSSSSLLQEPSVRVIPSTGTFNVVLTHATADFDSLAAAVGLAKLWKHEQQQQQQQQKKNVEGSSSSSSGLIPTYVILPRGAHPGVSKFLALHRHLFPIRSLKSLPTNMAMSSLNRLALVDAQRRDRLGPAEYLLQHAERVFVVDHHVDQDSDMLDVVTDYVVDKVGSVTTLIVEQLMQHRVVITEAEATLLALGIHADTGSLCFDSTTPRDAVALSWTLQQGASQTAIAEHVHSSLSWEQQAVLTQALSNSNRTSIHGVTLSTCLLHADGYINGLATVAQDALELSSSDIFLLAVVYVPQSGNKRRRQRKRNRLATTTTTKQDESSSLVVTNTGATSASKKKKRKDNNNRKKQQQGQDGEGKECRTTSLLTNRLLSKERLLSPSYNDGDNSTGILDQEEKDDDDGFNDNGETLLRQAKLRAAFDRQDKDGSGDVCIDELADALASSGVIASGDSVQKLMDYMDRDGDGRIDFDEFSTFANQAAIAREQAQIAAAKARAYLNYPDNDEDEYSTQYDERAAVTAADKTTTEAMTSQRKSATMVLIGRVKAGVNLKAVKLNKLFEPLGGGGHPKAASAACRLDPCDTVEEQDAQAEKVLQALVDELIETSLKQQPTVRDFMTSPALSVSTDMTEKQVQDLFQRYEIRACPVVDPNGSVVGLVSYKEVANAVKRFENREEKRKRRIKEAMENKDHDVDIPPTKATAVKAWMKQHVQIVEADRTMSEVQKILLDEEDDGDRNGVIPVVDTKENMFLLGMVTRTDLLRQHRYYASLPYHNKGFADSIALRKPMIELRKRLKQFDLD